MYSRIPQKVINLLYNIQKFKATQVLNICTQNLKYLHTEKIYSFNSSDHILSQSPLYNECIQVLEGLKNNDESALNEKFSLIRGTKRRASGETVHHFHDYRVVKVEGGKGGDGSVSFLRLFRNPDAGPDGGDGGKGGHVIFKAVRNRKSLNHIKPIIKAKCGNPGKSDDRMGQDAQNTIVEVPVGSVIKSGDVMVAELVSDGDIFLAARGGSGGKGNSYFASSVNQAPKVAEFGASGENFKYELEMRVMAEVGLIGFPNAGKSTLLRAISRSRPKVASYPFTTLVPHVGVVTYKDLRQVVVADIPGLIEGSHANLGLGSEFLKHAKRCASFLYVLDGSVDDPLEQLKILKNELEFYEAGLSAKPHVIILNKIDFPESKSKLSAIRNHLQSLVIPISAKMGVNLQSLIAVARLLADYESPSDFL